MANVDPREHLRWLDRLAAQPREPDRWRGYAHWLLDRGFVGHAELARPGVTQTGFREATLPLVHALSATDRSRLALDLLRRGLPDHAWQHPENKVLLETLAALGRMTSQANDADTRLLRWVQRNLRPVRWASEIPRDTTKRMASFYSRSIVLTAELVLKRDTDPWPQLATQGPYGSGPDEATERGWLYQQALRYRHALLPAAPATTTAAASGTTTAAASASARSATCAAPEHQAFLADLVDTLDEDHTWLVYADWLEEHGDEHADWLRQAVLDGDWDFVRDRMLAEVRPIAPLVVDLVRQVPRSAVDGLFPLADTGSASSEQEPKVIRTLASAAESGATAELTGVVADLRHLRGRMHALRTASDQPRLENWLFVLDVLLAAAYVVQGVEATAPVCARFAAQIYTGTAAERAVRQQCLLALQHHYLGCPPAQ